MCPQPAWRFMSHNNNEPLPLCDLPLSISRIPGLTLGSIQLGFLHCGNTGRDKSHTGTPSVFTPERSCSLCSGFYTLNGQQGDARDKLKHSLWILIKHYMKHVNITVKTLCRLNIVIYLRHIFQSPGYTVHIHIIHECWRRNLKLQLCRFGQCALTFLP